MANFYHYAPEFTSIDHLAPQLAVEQPFIQRPDGSYIQLEYRAGDVIPWAVTRYCLPAASINGAIVCGSGAKQCGPCCAGGGWPCWCECHLDTKTKGGDQ